VISLEGMECRRLFGWDEYNARFSPEAAAEFDASVLTGTWEHADTGTGIIFYEGGEASKKYLLWLLLVLRIVKVKYTVDE